MLSNHMFVLVGFHHDACPRFPYGHEQVDQHRLKTQENDDNKHSCCVDIRSHLREQHSEAFSSHHHFANDCACN